MSEAADQTLKTVARLLVEDRAAWFVDLEPFSASGELLLPMWSKHGFPKAPCMDVLSVVPLPHLRDVWRFRQETARMQQVVAPDLDALVAAMTAQPDDHEVAIIMICVNSDRHGYYVFFDVSNQSMLGYIPFWFKLEDPHPAGRHDPDRGPPGPAAQHGL